jgi:hypothetical protein
MSIDVLRSGGSRTALSSPAYSNSALTSISAGVTLGVGFDVTDSGLTTHAPYPGDDRTNVALSDSTVISVVGSAMLVSASAARTGLILAPPPVRKTGVTVRVINRSSFNHNFASPGTSFVQDNGNPRLISNSSSTFVWSEPDTRWYKSTI